MEKIHDELEDLHLIPAAILYDQIGLAVLHPGALLLGCAVLGLQLFDVGSESSYLIEKTPIRNVKSHYLFYFLVNQFLLLINHDLRSVEKSGLNLQSLGPADAVTDLLCAWH